jgi:alpha-1,3-glucan synthase
MGDLIGFEGFLNQSTPFNPNEYKALYKTKYYYHDFSISDDYKPTCEYPRFWNSSGQRVLKEWEDQIDPEGTFGKLIGCYDSEFDQVGIFSAPYYLVYTDIF